MIEFWNQRYDAQDFAYGEKPNQFLEEQLCLLPKGKILFVAEGEGRNAVFAAKMGHQVTAFDYSVSAQKKAMSLASAQNVSIEYLVSDVLEIPFQKDFFDIIVFVFAHFPEKIRKQAHSKLITLLKPNGKIIFEAFGKEQIKYHSGGPKEINMLFSEEEVKHEFLNIKFDFLKTDLIDLDEGPFHQGQAVVVRFVGTKS